MYKNVIELLESLGKIEQIALDLKISSLTIYDWKRKNKIPSKQMFAIIEKYKISYDDVKNLIG